MAVPNQQSGEIDIPETGARARTWRLMVDVASQMMREGRTPSVSEVAEEANVSRSTAYRYFPAQSSLIQAVVAETLGPILDWDTEAKDVFERLASLYGTSLPGIIENEATFRAALRQSIESQDELTLAENRRYGRGHRVDLINRALEGLELPEPDMRRLAKALSMTFGIENIIVLRDIWNCSDEEIGALCSWAARAMVRTALEEGGVKQVGSL